jgi:ribosomal protein S18 acetylase RimI-like enzyme
VLSAAFAEPPECQLWTPKEIIPLFEHYWHNQGVIHLAFCPNATIAGATETSSLYGRCIGFAVGMPLRLSNFFNTQATLVDTKESVCLDADFFSGIGIETEVAWGLSALGVDAAFRRRGVASTLLSLACHDAPASTKHFVLRVSHVKSTTAGSLYERQGFAVITSVIQEVPYVTLNAVEPVLMTKLLMYKHVKVASA